MPTTRHGWSQLSIALCLTVGLTVPLLLDGLLAVLALGILIPVTLWACWRPGDWTDEELQGPDVLSVIIVYGSASWAVIIMVGVLLWN